MAISAKALLLLLGTLASLGVVVFLFVVANRGVSAASQRRRPFERRKRLAAFAHLPFPWNILAVTGNGVGEAPAVFEALASQSKEEFEDRALDQLYNNLWHQGTIYVATPYALQMVLKQLPTLEDERRAALLQWIQDCVDAEKIGTCDGTHAGVWAPNEDQNLLRKHNVEILTVAGVLAEHDVALPPRAAVHS